MSFRPFSTPEPLINEQIQHLLRVATSSRWGSYLRKKCAPVQFLLRRITAHQRVYPNFMIIGAQKSGTTSLFRYLTQHPEVLAPFNEEKEIHYFDVNFERSRRWYRAHFPVQEEIRENDSLQKQTGESTPYYLFHPGVPGRIHNTCPDVKLIVILRNPVDRAYSHYQHQVQRDREPLRFKEALEAENDRLNGEVQKLQRNPFYKSYPHRRFSYRSRGIYYLQIKRYLEYFHPEQMCVLKSNKLFNRPSECVNKVFSFLGLSSDPEIEFKTYNVGEYERRIPEGPKKKLEEFYRPYNKKLSELLDRDFLW